MISFLSPYNFSRISHKMIPVTTILCILFFITGLYFALLNSPADYQQGEMVRVMYIHVPAAWMSLFVYMFIACCSMSSIIWNTKLSYILAIAASPIGASFALITLVTGSLWGKPIWGTYWVWDARLTSMFVLFLLYLSYIAVVNAGEDIFRAEKPAAAIAIIGAINVPIVKFSVDLWSSLHQPASVIKIGGPAIHHSMLLPLMLMFLSYLLYFITLLFLRSNSLLIKLQMRNQ